MLVAWWLYLVAVLWAVVGSGAFILAPFVVMQGVAHMLHGSGELMPAGISDCRYEPSLGPHQINEITSETDSSKRYFAYKGRRFDRTGDHWQGDRATAQISRDGRRLAFISYSEPMRPRDIHFFNPWEHWWGVYVDAYETNSGRKIAALAWTKLLSSEAPRLSVFWDGDRDLLAGGGANFGLERCIAPPEIIAIPHFEQTFTIQGDSQRSADVSLRRVDGDGNGLMDALAVEAAMNAPVSGTYRFSARFNALQPNPGFQAGSEYSQEVSQTLAPGPVHLELHFDPEALANLNFRGRLVLASLNIEGPSGFRVSSVDQYQVGPLPPGEMTRFRFAGQATAGHGSGIVDGSFLFLTPGGVCSWKGEVEQNEVRMPFTGQSMLAAGKAEIPFRVNAPKLKMTPGNHAESHLLSLECGGRKAFAVPGETYLAENELF